MNLPKLPFRLLVGSLILVLLLSACATTQPDIVIESEAAEEQMEAQPQAAIGETAESGVLGGADVLVSARSLVDYDFINRDGEVTGEIEDMILDLSTGEVVYVTVEYGGFLDIGDTELPMPLNAFRWGPDGQLVLNFDEAQLGNFPDLGAGWPDITTGAWDDEVVNFWRDAGLDPRFNFADASDAVVRTEEALGYDINDVGVGIGNVDDMLIDIGESRIEYVLVAYDPGVFNDELVAVPFNAFSEVFPGDSLTLDPTVDAVALEEAPRFTRNELTGPGSAVTFDDARNYWISRGFDSDAMIDDTVGDDTDEIVTADQESAIEQAGTFGVAGAEDTLARASTLLDYDVRNTLDEDIGEIEDMLIDVVSGEILFATLEYGGFLDLGDRHVPVPLNALSWITEDTLALNIDEQQLEALPDLDSSWPDPTDSAWDDDVLTFWRDLGVEPGYGASGAQTVMYVSDLINYGWTDVDLGTDASIHDLLIDLADSRALHVIVDYGGVFDNDLVAMPFSAMAVDFVNGEYILTPNVGGDVLQTAPRLERESFDQNGVFTYASDDEITTFWEDVGYPYYNVTE